MHVHVCVWMYACACSLKSSWDVRFGLHPCSTPVLLTSLFDKLASNRIAAQLSTNLMAPGQTQDSADHRVNPPAPPRSSSPPPFHLSYPFIHLYSSPSRKQITRSSVHLDLARPLPAPSPSLTLPAFFYLVPLNIFVFLSLISGTLKHTPIAKTMPF